MVSFGLLNSNVIGRLLRMYVNTQANIISTIDVQNISEVYSTPETRSFRVTADNRLERL